MTVADHLRRMMAPGRERWKPMLLGLSVCAASAGAAVLTQPSLVSLGFLMLAFAAWFAGACAMVGFARWFLAGEMAQAVRDRASAVERERK